MYLDGNLVWKFSLEMIDIWNFRWKFSWILGNLVWKLFMEISLEILILGNWILENLVSKFRWKFSQENQLEIQIEIQMEILIFGIFYPQKLVWKFTLEIQMEIQLGKLVENSDRNLDGIFYPWNFGYLEISMEIYFGNLDRNLVWKISSKFRWKF